MTSTLLGASYVLALALGGPPDLSGADETMTRLSVSAQKDLEGSIRELNQLRELIAAEKLPLAEELTAAEERVSQLRREHEQVTRVVDAGNLEMATIRAEMKVRQDELSYLGNLLDEYARGFEGRINPCELQYCGKALETAKQVTEDTALSMREKFDRQIDFVHVSLTRLSDAIGGMRFPGTGVDLLGNVVDGQFALIGPVALFADHSGVAGLVLSQPGSTQPLVRPLEGQQQASIGSLIEQGEGTFPLDPTRGGALKALVQRTNVIHIFKKGGPIMWPLLVASILALATALERVLFLLREKIRRDPKALQEFFAAVTQGNLEEAIRLGKTSKYYVVRALGSALAHKETSLASALLYAQAQELKRFQRGIPVLDTVITLSPLLGLLGTVTGMMGSFSLIGGELGAPGEITGGIAEALIATAFGLGIAITALLPFNFLNARVEDARHELESASTQLELLLHPQAVLIPAPRVTPGEAAVAGREPVGAGRG